MLFTLYPLFHVLLSFTQYIYIYKLPHAVYENAFIHTINTNHSCNMTITHLFLYSISITHAVWTSSFISITHAVWTSCIYLRVLLFLITQFRICSIHVSTLLVFPCILHIKPNITYIPHPFHAMYDNSYHKCNPISTNNTPMPIWSCELIMHVRMLIFVYLYVYLLLSFIMYHVYTCSW